MTETLLSPSNILLFGRVVEDLQIKLPARPKSVANVDRRVRLASTGPFAALDGLQPQFQLDGAQLNPGNRVLLKDQQDPAENGIYEFTVYTDNNNAQVGKFVRDESSNKDRDFWPGMVIQAKAGGQAGHRWALETDEPTIGEPLTFAKVEPLGSPDGRHGPFADNRLGHPSQLELQLTNEMNNQRTARIARIYAFSFEGTYYELDRPAMFLVHGDGIPASEVRYGKAGRVRPARAPGDPSLTGLAAADFQYAEDLKAWSYDKADYTIRMDVETGMFEQVLLDMFFGDGHGVSGAKVSGAKVSGAKVSGAKVSGAKVSGAKLSGARLSGWRGDASD